MAVTDQGALNSSERVLVPVDRGLYEQALQAAAYFGLSVEEWLDRSISDKLAAEPIRLPTEGEPGPVRTPFVESGITTRDSRSSAG